MTMSEKESEEFRILVDGIRDGREARERDEFRRSLASKVKPTALAASLTPYDAGLGDLAYAAGELIDPEGEPKTAAMAAGMGLVTGGVGSGAMAARSVGKLKKSKPKDLYASHPSTRDRIKKLDPNASVPPTLEERANKTLEILAPNPNPKTNSEKFNETVKDILRKKLEKEASEYDRISKNTRKGEAAVRELEATGKAARNYGFEQVQSKLAEADNQSITDEMLIDYMSSKNILK